MEMSQMVSQALWARDSPLLQLPHVSKELAAKCAQAGIETVFDLQEMEARTCVRVWGRVCVFECVRLRVCC